MAARTRRSAKRGLPPGALVHVGERKQEASRVTALRYVGEELEEREIPRERIAEELGALRAAPGVLWVDVEGLHEPAVVEDVGDAFGLSSLLLEDVLDTEQRAKLEEQDDAYFLVLKAPYLDDAKRLHVEQVSFVLGDRFVVSFQERSSPLLEPIRRALASGRGRLRRAGSDYLLWSLLDTVVDESFVVLEAVEQRLDGLEDTLVSERADVEPQGLLGVRRTVAAVRRALLPSREIVGRLYHLEHPLLSEPTRVFLRDLQDHALHAADTAEHLAESADDLLTLYVSVVNTRMQLVMRLLTGVSTIFLPLTFITGIYGMNFRYMPELDEPWGYPLVLGGMLLLGVGLFAFFRLKRWV